MNLPPQERKGERSRRAHSSSPGVGRSVVQLYSRLAGCALSAMPLRRMGFLPPSFLYLLSRGPSLPPSLLSRVLGCWRKERGRRGKVDLAVKVSLSPFLLYSRGGGREELSQQCTTVVVVVLVCLLMCIRRLPPPSPSICRRRSHPFSLFFLTYTEGREEEESRKEGRRFFTSFPSKIFSPPPLSFPPSCQSQKPPCEIEREGTGEGASNQGPKNRSQKWASATASLPPSLHLHSRSTIHCMLPSNPKTPQARSQEKGEEPIVSQQPNFVFLAPHSPKLKGLQTDFFALFKPR